MTDLAARIAEEAAALPPEKQSSVRDFVLFVKQRANSPTAEDGDAAWERIINDAASASQTGGFFWQAETEGSEPLDLERM